MTTWMRIGGYEYEHNGHDFTGWCRCISGRLADGHWPQWNEKTGARR